MLQYMSHWFQPLSLEIKLQPSFSGMIQVASRSTSFKQMTQIPLYILFTYQTFRYNDYSKVE